MEWMESVVFVEEDFLPWEIQEKEDIFGDLTTITRMTKLTEGMVGSMKQYGSL